MKNKLFVLCAILLLTTGCATSPKPIVERITEASQAYCRLLMATDPEGRLGDGDVTIEDYCALQENLVPIAKHLVGQLEACRKRHKEKKE